MKYIIHFSMNNKSSIWLMGIIITIAGLYAGLNMKLETVPHIDPPIITVATAYPGLSPQEVAEQVSEPIEKQVNSLSEVKVEGKNVYL